MNEARLRAEWPALRACSERETRALIEYLRSTPVAGYAALVAHGQLRGWNVMLDGRDCVGRTLTIFKELGGVVAATTVAHPRFLVEEIHRVLHRADCSDSRSRESLDWLIARRRDETFGDWQLVLLDSTLGPMIVDGNKRAAAIYETSEPDVTLPAVLLATVDGGQVPPPP